MNNDLKNLRRRVDRARDFPKNTCGASRHVQLMADELAAGLQYRMLQEDPKYCAESMLSVLESLWKARTELAKLKAKGSA